MLLRASDRTNSSSLVSCRELSCYQQGCKRATLLRDKSIKLGVIFTEINEEDSN